MSKYGRRAKVIIEKTMREFKEGRLRSGRGKRPVKDRRQALAIGLSKARAKHYEVAGRFPASSH